jgi:hypothetical protein
VVDQPYYHGDWSPAGDEGFEEAYHALQVNIAPDGLGVLPVAFRSPDGTVSTPAAAVVRPAPERAPYFRFGHEGLAAGIVVWPSQARGSAPLDSGPAAPDAGGTETPSRPPGRR